jgi:PPE-repeat protein
MHIERDRTELEARANQLRHKVQAARIRYEGAEREFQQAAGYARELGLETVDGSHAMSRAAAYLNQSIAEYGDAVAEFSDVILNQLGNDRLGPAR